MLTILWKYESSISMERTREKLTSLGKSYLEIVIKEQILPDGPQYFVSIMQITHRSSSYF